MESSSIRQQPPTPRSPKPIVTSQTPPNLQFQSTTTRRSSLAAASAVLLLISPIHPATALQLPDFNIDMVAKEQTIEEATANIRADAEALLSVKSLIESKSWGEAQRSLRKSSALLKKDVYTVIQSRPGNERPLLRKLYSDLFNGVTRLDYAARDGDKARVEEFYARISAAVDEILSRI